MKGNFMTNKSFILGLALGISASLHAYAGGVSGGGGKGVVCRGAEGNVKSVELLDLWEAQNITGEEIPVTDESVVDQVRSKIPMLRNIYNERKWSSNEQLEQTLRREAELFMAGYNVRYMKGIKLSLTQDSFEQIVPSNCEVEQIAIYNNTTTSSVIFINADLYEKMNATNKAALALHEVVYAHLRTYSQENNSLRTRRIIGRIFSGGTFQLLAESLPEEYIECESNFASRYSRVYMASASQQSGSDTFFHIVADWIFGTALISPTLGGSTASAKSAAFFNTMKSAQACDDQSLVFQLVGGNQLIDFESTMPLAPEQVVFYGRCEEGKHVAYMVPLQVYYNSDVQSPVFLQHPDTHKMKCEFKRR